MVRRTLLGCLALALCACGGSNSSTTDAGPPNGMACAAPSLDGVAPYTVENPTGAQETPTGGTLVGGTYVLTHTEYYPNALMHDYTAAILTLDTDAHVVRMAAKGGTGLMASYTVDTGTNALNFIGNCGQTRSASIFYSATPTSFQFIDNRFMRTDTWVKQ